MTNNLKLTDSGGKTPNHDSTFFLCFYIFLIKSVWFKKKTVLFAYFFHKELHYVILNRILLIGESSMETGTTEKELNSGHPLL